HEARRPQVNHISKEIRTSGSGILPVSKLGKTVDNHILFSLIGLDNASFVYIEGINSTQRHTVETFNHSTAHVLHRKSGVGHGTGRLTAQVGPHITSSIEGRTTQAHVRDKAHSLEHEVREVSTTISRISQKLSTVDISDTNN